MKTRIHKFVAQKNYTKIERIENYIKLILQALTKIVKC